MVCVCVWCGVIHYKLAPQCGNSKTWVLVEGQQVIGVLLLDGVNMVLLEPFLILLSILMKVQDWLLVPWLPVSPCDCFHLC